MKGSARNPFLLHLDQFFYAFNHFFWRKLRETKLSVRTVHSFEVFVWAEQHHAVIVGDISFEAFKALDAVVKGRICRVQFKRLISLDDRTLPSSVVDIIINVNHVIG